MLGSGAANCDHNVYLEWFKLMYKKDIGVGLSKISDISQRYVGLCVNFIFNLGQGVPICRQGYAVTQ
jgi:hypothetical protein